MALGAAFLLRLCHVSVTSFSLPCQFFVTSLSLLCHFPLFHYNSGFGRFQTLARYGEGGEAWLGIGLDDDNQLAMEGTHGGLSEDLGRGGIAVAAGIELGRLTFHRERELVVGIGTEVTLLIYDADGVEREVGAV